MWLGHTDSTKVTQLLITSAPTFWAENKLYISPFEDTTVCLMLLVSLVLICEHNGIHVFYDSVSVRDLCEIEALNLTFLNQNQDKRRMTFDP